MTKEIIIEPAELSIIKEQNGIYSVYASLFDIFAYTDDRLYTVTTVLHNRNVFSFSTIGQYVGVNAVKYMPFTYDSGINSMIWLRGLLDAIAYIKSGIPQDEIVSIKINKQKILDNEICYNKTISNELSKQILEVYLKGLEIYLSKNKQYAKLFSKDSIAKIINNKCKYNVEINDKILFLYNKEI